MLCKAAFQEQNLKFCIGHVSFKIIIKYSGQVLRHTSMEFNKVVQPRDTNLVFIHLNAKIHSLA